MSMAWMERVAADVQNFYSYRLNDGALLSHPRNSSNSGLPAEQKKHRSLAPDKLADEERYKINFSAIGGACSRAAEKFIPPQRHVGV